MDHGIVGVGPGATSSPVSAATQELAALGCAQGFLGSLGLVLGVIVVGGGGLVVGVAAFGSRWHPDFPAPLGIQASLIVGASLGAAAGLSGGIALPARTAPVSLRQTAAVAAITISATLATMLSPLPAPPWAPAAAWLASLLLTSAAFARANRERAT